MTNRCGLCNVASFIIIWCILGPSFYIEGSTPKLTWILCREEKKGIGSCSSLPFLDGVARKE